MTELFDMGGYEWYVWGSVGLGLAVFAWNVIAPALQRRAVFAQLAEGDGEDAGESS
ncbi:MAG: heme exporter protein CcmD [Panacagrimonas sp.]